MEFFAPSRSALPLRSLLNATLLGISVGFPVLASGAAFAADPIRIGVIAEAQAIAGASISPGRAVGRR